MFYSYLYQATFTVFDTNNMQNLHIDKAWSSLQTGTLELMMMTTIIRKIVAGKMYKAETASLYQLSALVEHTYGLCDSVPAKSSWKRFRKHSCDGCTGLNKQQHMFNADISIERHDGQQRKRMYLCMQHLWHAKAAFVSQSLALLYNPAAMR